MEMSSKLKAMKFMKRKDDAEERKQAENEQQKSVERTHWTLSEEGKTEGQSKPKFIIEYDYTGGVSTSGAVGRQSFKNFNKKDEGTAITKSEPLNKVPKLTETNKKKP